jgi:hypothetical protein
MHTNAVANYSILQLHLWHDLHNKVFEVKHKLYKPDVVKPHAQTLWGDGEPKERFIVKEMYVRDAALQRYGLSIRVWLRLDIKQNSWSVLGGGSCISYQFRENAQTYSHQPQYTADNDAAKTDMCTAHM